MFKLPSAPKGFMKVENPDHPFTFTGPDYLYSDESGLLAVFRPTKEEVQNLKKLQARVANTIIAYPPHTLVVLVQDHMTTNNSLISLDKILFNELIEPKDIARARVILKKKRNTNSINSIKKIQHDLFRQQAQIQLDNVNYFDKWNYTSKKNVLVEKTIKKALYLDPFSRKEIRTRANIYELKNKLIGMKKLSKKISDLIELRPYFEFVLNSEIQMDNAVPYLNSFSKKVLGLNHIPIIRNDPYKPLRIASLFGWHIAPLDTVEELSDRI
jgi:hypothetical protein